MLQVRAAASDAARVIMHNLSGPGVKLVLPTLLKGLAERAWRTKHASIELLGAMSNCAPSQLAASLPTVIPALAGVLNDAHPKVSAAASGAISLVGDAVRNPEVAALAPVLIRAIADPVRATRKALDALRDTVFVHTVDVSSLALILPVISRGLKERSGDSKKTAARILGNLASLVGNPADLAPYVPGLMPDLRATLIDALPDVRATAARALGSLVRGLGQVWPLLPPIMHTLACRYLVAWHVYSHCRKPPFVLFCFSVYCVITSPLSNGARSALPQPHRQDGGRRGAGARGADAAVAAGDAVIRVVVGGALRRGARPRGGHRSPRGRPLGGHYPRRHRRLFRSRPRRARRQPHPAGALLDWLALLDAFPTCLTGVLHVL